MSAAPMQICEVETDETTTVHHENVSDVYVTDGVLYVIAPEIVFYAPGTWITATTRLAEEAGA